MRAAVLFSTLAIAASSCGDSPSSMSNSTSADVAERRDLHSHADTSELRTRSIALDLDVDFDARALRGTALIEFERLADTDHAVLDTRALDIQAVETSADGVAFERTDFSLGEADAILGAPLRIELPAGHDAVRIRYATTAESTGLQWLAPEQTAGKKHPFLFSQSQAIHARSWIPCQDTPGVRATYSATIRAPEGLTAVMSAERSSADSEAGARRFEMPQAIPSYLIALAVGDLAFEPISDRSGVWAEPSVVASAAREFADIEAMMRAAESLYGPYRWERYDILVLPPSFPFGGMENPRLTFATPTLLAGDKSLVNVIAHELAHSWSGNLVTNATWRDFWLNEGFTVYLENRVQEEVFGAERAAMEAALEVRDLEEEMRDLEPRDQVLHVDLAGRDPDDGFTLVPYVKGMLFLRTIEEAVGRERFDDFLRGYFERFAFQSITTDDFVRHLDRELPAAREKLDLEAWLREPGLPATAAKPQSDLLQAADRARQAWEAGETSAADLPTADWATQQWLRFLAGLSPDLPVERMAELDREFNLTQVGNAEIAHRWLLESVKRGYEPAYPRLREFLVGVGRRKFLKPLYEELARTPDGRERAVEIYREARPGYHPIAQSVIDEILGRAGG